MPQVSLIDGFAGTAAPPRTQPQVTDRLPGPANALRVHQRPLPRAGGRGTQQPTGASPHGGGRQPRSAPLPATRREDEDEQGHGSSPFAVSPLQPSGARLSARQHAPRPGTKRVQPPEPGPQRGSSPREAALPPGPQRCQRPRLRFQREAAPGGPGTKGPLSPPRSGGAGPGGRAAPAAPSGGPAPGRSVKVKAVRHAEGPQLSRELAPAPPASNLPGTAAPPPFPAPPPYRGSPRRAQPSPAASRSPPPRGQRPPGAASPPPPFHEETFPSQLPAPPEPGSAPGPPAPHGEQVRQRGAAARQG
ncbi:basic proline-rich protein-like [Falco cherrug]|uniref:basic proline-rich protein-like n=1 Tax=Falco cherrug TaxID=345164 RepID=UPI002479640E|nr:basic proline-rich protein-like [Falco cherrug]